MRQTYLALIDHEVSSDGTDVYGITFPDFPGCVSVGSSPDEALRSGQEALAGHVKAMADDGERLPIPSRMAQIEAGPGEVLVMVSVAMPGKPKRINVMLDEHLIEEIDAVTNNRSAFLAAAARAALVER